MRDPLDEEIESLIRLSRGRSEAFGALAADPAADVVIPIIVAPPKPTWTAEGEDKPVQAAKIEMVLNWSVTADTGRCMRGGVEHLHRTTVLEAGGHALTFRKPSDEAWQVAVGWIAQAGTVGARDKAVVDFLSATLAHYSYPTVGQISPPSRHLAAAKIIDLWNDNRPEPVGARAAAQVAETPGAIKRWWAQFTGVSGAVADGLTETVHQVRFPNGTVHVHATERAARASASAILGTVYERREVPAAAPRQTSKPRRWVETLIMLVVIAVGLMIGITAPPMLGVGVGVFLVAFAGVGLAMARPVAIPASSATLVSAEIPPQPVEAPNPHAVLDTWFSPHAMCPSCKVTDVHDVDPAHTGNGIGRRCACGHRWTQRTSYDG